MTDPDEQCRQCGMPPDPDSSFLDPEGKRPPIPLCVKCKAWAEALVKKLGEDPELKERFALAVAKAESGGVQ